MGRENMAGLRQKKMSAKKEEKTPGIWMQWILCHQRGRKEERKEGMRHLKSVWESPFEAIFEAILLIPSHA